MNTSDLEARYGQMVPVEDLARFFRTRLRTMSAVLRRKQVPIYDFGETRVVSLAVVERVFELQPLGDEDVQAHFRAKMRANYRDDGTPKPIGEYLDELRGKTPALLARLEAERERSRSRDLVEAP